MEVQRHYPHVDRLFSGGRPSALTDRPSLHALNSLLKETDSLGIGDRDLVLREKATAGPSKFWSTISELRIAALLADAGCSVRMLPDSVQARGRRHSLPDLHVHGPEGLEFHVEVRRLNRRDSRFGGFLREKLSSTNLRFRISWVPLGSSLCTPGTDFEDREPRDQNTQQTIETLVNELRKRDMQGDNEGEIVIGDSKFKFERMSNGDDEYVGGGWCAARIIDDEHHGAYLVDALYKKAEQGSKRSHRVRHLPYVVALDVLEFEHGLQHTADQLIGGAVRDCDRELLYREVKAEELAQIEANGWSGLIARYCQMLWMAGQHEA